MKIRHLAKERAPLLSAESGGKRILELLWGDRVAILEEGESHSKARARGRVGYVANADLGDEALLEIYFIDVGQGDGILIRTPDGRHIMIDGGFKRAGQPTGKNAADFVDWKFAKDYGMEQIQLDVMMASHNDADHYGGLWDLLNVKQSDELDAKDVRVEAFYHAGVGWWVNPANGERWLGPATADNQHLTQLMGDRAQVEAALGADAEPRLQGEWAQFMRTVTEARTREGGPTPIRRLSQADGYLPGFKGEDSQVAIRVLAPVQTEIDGRPALRKYKSEPGKNTNGNSLLLRLDYKRARILLTGDLNADSQRALLEDYAGRRLEFQCDVAKACHHGSDDVSYEFLNALKPAATVISSGDSEGHDHPRPGVIAASATTGHLKLEGDAIVTPLVYSTELARSISLGRVTRLDANGAPDTATLEDAFDALTVHADVTNAGALRPIRVQRKLKGAYIVTGLIYGLVNVRTDGQKILCATLNEQDAVWQIKTFQSRF